MRGATVAALLAPATPATPASRRYRYAMSDGVFRFVAERQIEGGGEAFESYWTLTLTRAE